MMADKAAAAEEDKFEKLNLRLDGLTKAADAYKGSDVEDLADGLSDDAAGLKKRVDAAKKKTDNKKGMSVFTAAGAAAIVAVLAFVFGPRKAGAAEMLAFSNSPMPYESSLPYGPVVAEADMTYIAADKFGGKKEGFVFKTGGLGLGYYADTGELAEELSEVSTGQGGLMNLKISTPAAIGLGVAGVGITLVGRKVWPMIKMARMLAAMNKAAVANAQAGGKPGGFGDFKAGVPRSAPSPYNPPAYTPPPYTGTAAASTTARRRHTNLRLPQQQQQQQQEQQQQERRQQQQATRRRGRPTSWEKMSIL